MMKTAILKFINRFTSKPSGVELASDVIADYTASRGKLDNTYICHAPFSNMYFNVHGDCAPCWLTFIDPDSYKEKSIREIWFGEKYQTLREKLLKYDLTFRCSVCLKNLQSGNFTSVLAKAYDVNPIQQYPSMMELEIENTCNLECVMCIGELSSAIRKNREKLPPIKSPYNDAFVEQLEEFIPHLKELRFNGGEPFLINAVFRIFEKVEKLNPKLKIVIATNGTVWNYKVREWLDKLNIHINFSLDSLTPEIYEAIRVNAHFDRVMEHFLHFRKYCFDNKRTMCLMVNPMRNNWHEMPNFIRFVNKHNINIWFNTIHRPEEWSIWALPSATLTEVYQQLSAVVFEKEDRAGSLSAYNISIYNNLVNVQIKNWLKEAIEREEREATKTPIELEEDAQVFFENALHDYIYVNFNEGEEQKIYRYKTVIEKTNAIVERIKASQADFEFYKIVKDVPTDVYYKQMESRSVNDLLDEFQQRFKKPTL
ncbi:MAG: radical SAM protein [Chitinophagales bacterium]|nr:radical SAM protein [Chitinophagales bacterium]